MTRAERIELLVIGIAAVIPWLVQPYLPPTIPLWQIVLGLSALLLAQSLIRDVVILLGRRRSPSAGPRIEAQCFCLESSVGSTGVIIAAILGMLATATRLTVGRWQFVVAVAGTMALGFII